MLPGKVFAGGPLSKKSGDKLVAAGVKLYMCYGGTEYGVHTKILDAEDSSATDANAKTSADWEWVRFPDSMKCRWVPQGNGTYELHCLVRILHSTLFRA
jgi:hypothetical protein